IVLDRLAARLAGPRVLPLRLGAEGGAAQTARDLHASRLVVHDLARSLVVAGLRVVVRIEVLPAAHAGDDTFGQAARLPLAARGAEEGQDAVGDIEIQLTPRV